jgi:hypothetical protein
MQITRNSLDTGTGRSDLMGGAASTRCASGAVPARLGLDVRGASDLSVGHQERQDRQERKACSFDLKGCDSSLTVRQGLDKRSGLAAPSHGLTRVRPSLGDQARQSARCASIGKHSEPCSMSGSSPRSTSSTSFS